MSDHKIRISAKGFFFNSKNEILLVESERISHEGRSDFASPGGGVEEDEDLRSALERELTEETGYFGHAGGVVFIQDYLNKGRGRQLEVFFVGLVDENRQPLATYDHSFKFFSEEEFLKISFLPRVNPFELRKKLGIDYRTYLNRS
jgi:ADP-ribose pyrophosphatase YjhB (NUDIX family)